MAGIYHNATLGVISLSSDGENWITIADKNLGATTVWNDGDTLSEANAGKYYQWGNNYGFPFTGSVTTSSTQVDASNYGPGNYYNSSTFITISGTPYRWDTTDNGNLWGGVTGTNAAMQGPCASGYHVPLTTEWKAVRDIRVALGGGSSDGTNFAIALKLPFAGYRYSQDASVSGQGTNGFYWSSSRYNANNAYLLYFYSIALGPQDNSRRALGFSVRPFKNDAVVPDYTWTKLYGDDIPKPKQLKRLQKGGNYYYFKDAPTHASAISLNKSSITLTEAGQTEQLVATVTPSDAINKKVIWSSSNASIATVSQTGLVTCVTPGIATITATTDDEGLTATCSIKDGTFADFLLVGGGGGGGCARCAGPGGGGGGGGVIYCSNYLLNNNCVYNINIGAGGGSSFNGCNSSFGTIIAYGGGHGGNGCICYSGTSDGGPGGDGGSGGGGANSCGTSCGGKGCTGQGCNGGVGLYDVAGGGGGGAAQKGCDGYYSSGYYSGKGGIGLYLNIDGTYHHYGSGGTGGGSYAGVASGGGAGGNDSKCNGGNATYYGGGGGGAGTATTYCITNGGNGCQGIFILRYQTSCGYNITGGCKYTCGDYTIHCFTSDGTLTVS